MAIGRSLCCASLLLLAGCGQEDDDGSACTQPGRSETCGCDGGVEGSRLCLPGGALSECRCGVTRTVPCADPGVFFSCFCADAGVGIEYCQDDGHYTSCDCSAPVAGATDAGSGDGQGGAGDAPAGCPAPFSCVEQMGAAFCAGSGGIPPLCQSSAECAVAGMPDAECLDPGVGVTVCLQFCEPQ